MGNLQIPVAENGTVTLATAGKYCDRNVDVNVSVLPALQEKIVTPAEQPQEITPDMGKEGLSKVTVEAIPEQYIVPSGMIFIEGNGLYDVREYASADVWLADAYLVTSLINRSITSYSNDQLASIGTYAFAGCLSLASVNLPNVNSLGQYAFHNCLKLAAIELPKISNVQSYAFRSCSALVTANFPNATTIGQYTFQSCSKLANVSVPKAQVISTYAFNKCTSLARIDLPAAYSITANAFNGCSALTTLVLSGTTVCSLAATSAFTGTPIASGTGNIYVPDDLVTAYRTATNWTAYAAMFKPISELEEQV